MLNRNHPVKLMVLVCLSMSVFGVAVKADDGQTRKELEAIYARRDKAMMAKDIASVKSTEAEDYTEKRQDGKVQNREQADEETARLLPMIKKVHSFWTKVESVKEGEDNKVIVEFTDGGKMSVVDPNGNTHILEGSGRSRDTWERTDKGWKIKYHERLETNTKLDGKPIE